MNSGLDALGHALDEAPSEVTFFLRDDDAGWHHERLHALLDATRRCEVPIDLAVIPMATDAAFAGELCARLDADVGLLSVHQHGYAHVDHETFERRCEFGEARPLESQRIDLVAGRSHLLRLFGERLQPFFTPPWNRCSSATPVLLAELGYALLSRSRGAPAQSALPELSVSVDWCRLSAQAAESGESPASVVAARIADRMRRGGPVGLMLHHAQMDATGLQQLTTVLRVIDSHPRARWSTMGALQASSPDVPSQSAAISPGASA